jgi:hypothetical protein
MTGNHFISLSPSDCAMPYLKNALGGLGRTVTDTARLAFAQAGAVRRAGVWRKFAVYAAVFALPGGSLAVLLYMWAERRRAKRNAQASAASGAAACTGRQSACRASCATPNQAKAHGLRALRRWRRNDA